MESNNTWKLNDPRPGSWPWFLEAIVVTDADFVSVDSTGISGPRKADGSLPDINFLKLAQGSSLIDAGVNIGLAYNGAAPDIGYQEYETTSSQIYALPVVRNGRIIIFNGKPIIMK